MRESFVKPDGAVPKSSWNWSLSRQISRNCTLGRGSPHHRFMEQKGTVAEVIEAVALGMIECGVQVYKSSGLDLIETAEK